MPAYDQSGQPNLAGAFLPLAGDLEPKFFVRSEATAAALVIYGALAIVSSPPHLQERWRSYARRNADEDAREWQRTCHEVSRHTQLSSAIYRATQAMSAIGT